MTTTSEKPRGGDAVEALLRQAEPRPAPPPDVETQVRDAVAAEWQKATRGRRRRRRVLAAGLAASIALVAAVAFNLLTVGTPSAPAIAGIDKAYGPVYTLGPDAELIGVKPGDMLVAGQVLVSHRQAGIGLRWNGVGSLRADEETRLEFVSADEVFLHSGRLYFDSRASAGETSQRAATLTVLTPHGAIRHLGTQFMAEVDPTTLRVSVREGSVAVAGRLYDGTASRGQQLAMGDGGRPVLTNISPHSAAWQWVEATAPTLDVDGMSTWDFLQWVGRETGLRVEFASARAEEIARAGILRGRVNADPRTELRIRMLGEDLGYAIAAGVITVSVNE